MSITTPNEGGRNGPLQPATPTPTPDAPARPVEPPLRRGGPGFSGRRFVILSGVVIVLLWALLFLVFRPGLDRYKMRTDFGRKEVAPAVFELRKVQPPGVDSRAWDEAVRDAYGLVATTTESGTIDLDGQKALRDQIKAVAARAVEHPERAVDELAALWDDVAARARKARRPGEPEIDRRHPRPSIFPQPKE
ncbi:hypothetical protein [Planctomyces sp. SH-PL62]|uniref:hypothetical protein n=1 Tax=Planctomyces sp. SH-PL62 TaxID=1636152 RepID=UPI00078D9255|nr:hypothetical protein [Planctomyces sp. SH-PL62]AMV40702.1 hypothetical protein VT85_24940 [Planctomyces sp. SH-PL62]